MGRSATKWGLAFVLAGFATLLVPGDAQAKRFIDPYMYGQFSTKSSIPVERQIQRRIREAQELIEQKLTARAIGLLQTILEMPSDSFVEMDEGRFMSAKFQAQLLIEGLGPAGVADYRRQYEDEAQEKFRAGLESRDPEKLAAVMRTFFLTEAGFEAANALASFQLDKGNPGVALMYLDRLLNSKAHAGKSSAEVMKKKAIALAMIGGETNVKSARDLLKPLALPENWTVDDILESVAARPGYTASATSHWPMFGGDPRRSAVSRGTLPVGPLNLKWKVNYLDSVEDQGQVTAFVNSVKSMVQNRVNQQQVSLFEMHPLAIGDRMYYRTAEGATWAVDIKTGRRKWKSLLADGNLNLGTGQPDPNMHFKGEYYPHQPANYSEFVQNSVIGSLSADHKRIYQVDRVGGSSVSNRGHMSYSSHNRLTALDIKTGKVQWILGPGEIEEKEQMPHIYFFGPPLPVAENLYVMGEVQAELRLICIEAETGTIQWSQVLCAPERGISADGVRRLLASPISYHDGILVCPTNLDRVLAVDPLTRSLLWAYSFGSDISINPHHGFNPQAVKIYAADAPIIQDGKVIITSPYNRTVHCINIANGEVAWTQDRQWASGSSENDGASHYVAGIYGDKVVLVAHNNIRALALNPPEELAKEKKTKVLWNSGLPSIPVGRGVCADNHYYVPLADGSVIKVSIKSGRRESFSQLGTGFEDRTMGNLLIHENLLMISNHTGVQAIEIK